jgi:hypothetical protein
MLPEDKDLHGSVLTATDVVRERLCGAIAGPLPPFPL